MLLDLALNCSMCCLTSLKPARVSLRCSLRMLRISSILSWEPALCADFLRLGGRCGVVGAARVGAGAGVDGPCLGPAPSSPRASSSMERACRRHHRTVESHRLPVQMLVREPLHEELEPIRGNRTRRRRGRVHGSRPGLRKIPAPARGRPRRAVVEPHVRDFRQDAAVSPWTSVPPPSTVAPGRGCGPTTATATWRLSHARGVDSHTLSQARMCVCVCDGDGCVSRSRGQRGAVTA